MQKIINNKISNKILKYIESKDKSKDKERMIRIRKLFKIIH